MLNYSLKRGRFYRWKDTQTIYLLQSEWQDPQRFECVIIKDGMESNPETIVHDAADLAKWLGCEVVPTWQNFGAWAQPEGEPQEPAIPDWLK